MEPYNSEETYTLEDLANWRFDGRSLAVLGFPVRHSISPAMHNAAIAELAREDPRFSDWRYFRFEVKPEDLLEALPVFHEKGFFGLNLTVPHKEIALSALPKVDPAAQEIGAVNTLKRLETGYEGFNTDGYGLAQGILTDLQCELAGREITILGAGGAGRAAAVQALRSDCRSLTIINRNPERLSKLVDSLRPIATERSISLSGKAPNDPSLELPEDALLINATSLGLKADDPLPLPESALSTPVALYDMIYNPSQTKLMDRVVSQGGRAANGLSMLVYQGVRALEIWSDRPVNPDTMNQAAKLAIA